VRTTCIEETNGRGAELPIHDFWELGRTTLTSQSANISESADDKEGTGQRLKTEDRWWYRPKMYGDSVACGGPSSFCR
jgi:hypothetical protein